MVDCNANISFESVMIGPVVKGDPSVKGGTYGNIVIKSDIGGNMHNNANQ